MIDKFKLDEIDALVGSAYAAVSVGEYEKAMVARPELKARAYGPGMTPHADDCECYVCRKASDAS